MIIYYVSWARVDWSARYNIGYNDIIEKGVYFAKTKELAEKMCPITKEEGNIKIMPIHVYTDEE